MDIKHLYKSTNSRVFWHVTQHELHDWNAKVFVSIHSLAGKPPDRAKSCAQEAHEQCCWVGWRLCSEGTIVQASVVPSSTCDNLLFGLKTYSAKYFYLAIYCRSYKNKNPLGAQQPQVSTKRLPTTFIMQYQTMQHDVASCQMALWQNSCWPV